MKTYYLNRDRSKNPNYNNEVHSEDCRLLATISRYNLVVLGRFNNGVEAVNYAVRNGYTHADGCPICSPEAHRK